MESMQLKAELFRQIDTYADDTDILQQVLDFFKKLTSKKKDEALMSKEDFFKMLDESKREAEEGKVKSFTDINEMHKWLNSL